MPRSRRTSNYWFCNLDHWNLDKSKNSIKKICKSYSYKTGFNDQEECISYCSELQKVKKNISDVLINLVYSNNLYLVELLNKYKLNNYLDRNSDIIPLNIPMVEITDVLKLFSKDQYNNSNLFVSSEYLIYGTYTQDYYYYDFTKLFKDFEFLLKKKDDKEFNKYYVYPVEINYNYDIIIQNDVSDTKINYSGLLELLKVFFNRIKHNEIGLEVKFDEFNFTYQLEELLTDDIYNINRYKHLAHAIILIINLTKNIDTYNIGIKIVDNEYDDNIKIKEKTQQILLEVYTSLTLKYNMRWWQQSKSVSDKRHNKYMPLTFNDTLYDDFYQLNYNSKDYFNDNFSQGYCQIFVCIIIFFIISNNIEEGKDVEDINEGKDVEDRRLKYAHLSEYEYAHLSQYDDSSEDGEIYEDDNINELLNDILSVFSFDKIMDVKTQFQRNNAIKRKQIAKTLLDSYPNSGLVKFIISELPIKLDRTKSYNSENVVSTAWGILLKEDINMFEIEYDNYNINNNHNLDYIQENSFEHEDRLTLWRVIYDKEKTNNYNLYSNVHLAFNNLLEERKFILSKESFTLLLNNFAINMMINNSISKKNKINYSTIPEMTSEEWKISSRETAPYISEEILDQEILDNINISLINSIIKDNSHNFKQELIDKISGYEYDFLVVVKICIIWIYLLKYYNKPGIKGYDLINDENIRNVKTTLLHFI